MRKIILRVSDCVPGMTTAEAIYNEYGAVVMSENTILDEHLINKLKKLDIEQIRVFEHNEDIIRANSSQLFKANYSENVEVVKNLLYEISAGKNADAQKVEALSESIFANSYENRDIVSCINQIRSADEYIYTHSINVSLISMLIGKWMKYDKNTIRLLVQAALLHDIGKTQIPQEILNKPGRLTSEEYDEIKKHPVYSYRIVEKIPGISKDICSAILMHHEREDGSGYPMGIRGEQIHELAKVIAVADIYDAMTSNKVYKEKESPFDVFGMFEKQTFGCFNTKVVNAFLSNIASYYIGDFVRLNTGETGKIVYINPRYISQPIVQVNETYLDLSVDTKVKITEML